MSFYTSLTGLNGAQADIAAISNNVANVGTTGFKLSRAQFGDIFATSPLQNASGAIGSGTILKKVQQQFTQGNISASQNSLDMAISGQGFFALKPSLTSTQTVYTRNGSFSVNNNRYVVDSQGQYLQVFPVNSDGSVIATGIQSAKNLQLPSTSGLPNATSSIQLGLNLPADATIIPNNAIYTDSNPYKFDRTNSGTYNQSTSITIYDSLGNPTIATIYYVKTLNATSAIPNNRWQTHVFVGDKEVSPSLITSKDDQSKTIYINKYGQTTTDPTSFDSSFVANQPSPLYYQDDQIKKSQSTPAKVVGSIQNLVGFDFGDTDANKVTIITDPSKYDTTRESGKVSSLTSPFWGTDMFTISVDGSAPQSISINAGSYTGSELAAEMTRAVNAKFSNANYYRINDTYRDTEDNIISGNDVFNINISRTESDGSTTTLVPPLEIDLLGTAGADGTPAVISDSNVSGSQQLNYLDLTRDQLIALAQKKVNQALNARHAEFGKNSDWPDTANPPIVVGFDVATRALTFKADPLQLGSDASLPQNRYQTLQVYNPTSVTNDLGIPTQTSSSSATIGTNTYWSGSAVLPSGPPLTAIGDQRTGITVSYNKDSRQFVFSSGTTGESSTIKVGRATLAQAQDVKPQINSYDFTSLTLPQDSPITLEADGKSFTYFTETDVKNATDADKLIVKLQQALPVTITNISQIQAGTATSQPEQQKASVFGNILAGDTFNLSVIVKPGAKDPENLTVGPIDFDKDSTGNSNFVIGDTPTASERMNALIYHINLAIKNKIEANKTGSLQTVETADVTLPQLAIGETFTIAGLTLTATAAMSNAEVAAAFASLANGDTTGPATKVTYSGSLSGWSTSAIKNTNVVTVSAATKGNVTDLAATNTIAANVSAIKPTSASVTVTAPSVLNFTPVQGAAPVTESAAVTFGGLTTGQTLIIAGLTLTASAALTAAQVAAAFQNISAGGSGNAGTGYTITGTLSGYSTSAISGSAVVTFTSSTANSNVSDLTVAGTGTGTTANITQGVAPVTENATINFSGLTKGQSYTVDGLKLTATTTMTANEVAAAFASIAAGATPTNPAKGFFTGTLSGFSSGSASTSNVTFTSTTTNTNVLDITTSAGTAPVSTVTFLAMNPGDKITIAGQTLTASAALSASDVANAFSGIAVTGATVTGSIIGWKISVSAPTINFVGTAATPTAPTISAEASSASALTITQGQSGLYDATKDLACKLLPGQTNDLIFDYQSAGLVGQTLTLKQTVRGTDNNADLQDINYTDSTVYSSPTYVTQSGNAKTREIQNFTLKPQGQVLEIREGDVFVIKVPKSNGTEIVKQITVKDYSASASGDSTNPGKIVTVSDLLKSINAESSFSDIGSFDPNTKSGAPAGSVNFTFNQAAAITGKVSISQFKAWDTTALDVLKVRDDSIGPFSIFKDGSHRLAVQGNPNGESYHLNVQTGGIVTPVEAEGATGSKSQSGVQIGQSLATTSNSATIYAGNNDLLGIGAVKAQQTVAGTGLASTAATAYGTAAITPMSQTFLLNESLGENKLTFTVDGITGTIILPIRAYTGDTFASAIQQRVNQIQDPVSGRVVSGVSVKFDANNNRLVFTSGTTGSTSQINVVGSANFGLNSVTQTAGSVPSITNLVQATDANGNKLYVDGNGNISTVAPSTKLQSWSPLYLTPGELTFDTAGKLLSPKQGVVYSPFDPGNGSNPLNLTIDYGKFSTQYTQPFSVQSLTQDGYPSGSLNGLTIDSSGTVIANYTNGQTNALGKVMIANFANPNGLKQIGNADYVATSVSGQATLGQAGSDGLGSIQAGALEQSNVDITEELVKLITAQRNFQANSKAIETETSLTQTIIQIRA